MCVMYVWAPHAKRGRHSPSVVITHALLHTITSFSSCVFLCVSVCFCVYVRFSYHSSMPCGSKGFFVPQKKKEDLHGRNVGWTGGEGGSRCRNTEK